MSENINNTPQEDEIDLLDLFIVLLKHRCLIICSFLGVICLILAGYFFYPSWKYEKTLERQNVEAIMTLGTGSNLEAVGINYNIPSLFTSAPLLLQSLKNAGIQQLGPEDDSIDLTNPEQNVRALNYVLQIFVNHKTLDGETIEEKDLPFFYTLPSKDAQYFELKYYHKDSDLALAFLNSLYRNANQKLLENIQPQLQALAAAGETAGNKTTGTSAILQDAQQLSNVAQKILDGSIPALELLEQPYYVKNEVSKKAIQSSYRKMAVILIFAVFFLSIFLAFILEFIENIKSDEERMAKIRKALNKE